MSKLRLVLVVRVHGRQDYVMPYAFARQLCVQGWWRRHIEVFPMRALLLEV